MAMDQLWDVGISGGSVERGNLTPDRASLIYYGSPLGRAEPMPSWSKVRGDAAKRRQEPLGMPHRFKAFHRPFALSGGLMRVLGAIVQILRPAMLHRRHELAVSHPVAGQFVGHQHARYIPQTLEQFAEEPLGCCGVSPRLHQHLQDVAVLVDCTPQVMGDAVDLHEDLIEVPLVAGAGAAPAQLVGVGLPELGAPAPDRLITHHDTTRKHQLLDLTKAQREPKVQPHAMVDDLDRVAVAQVRRRCGAHPTDPSRAPTLTNVTVPSKWPAGTRLILRKERPHPGAPVRFTDADWHLVTGVLTDTPDGVIPGQLAGLELRHRQHARVEDRIRQAKATGLANLPFNSFDANAAWLEIIMAATDLADKLTEVGVQRVTIT